MNERVYTVYLHTSPSNKYYVGITRLKVNDRWRNGEGYRKQVFYNAIQKYGWDNFDHEIIASNLTKEEAENFEIKLIAELHSNDSRYGYNVDNGGNTVGKMSEKTRRKISEANKGENNGMYGMRGKLSPCYGKTLSKETKIKISTSIKGENNPMFGKKGKETPFYGKHHSQEHKDKMKNLMSGENNPMYGVKVSEETKKKISLAFKGGNHPSAKKVVCEDREFDCIKDCAIFYNIHPTTMRRWLSGERKMPLEWQDKKLSYLEGGD